MQVVNIFGIMVIIVILIIMVKIFKFYYKNLFVFKAWKNCWSEMGRSNIIKHVLSGMGG
jgi:hypothetical protein